MTKIELQHVYLTRQMQIGSASARQLGGSTVLGVWSLHLHPEEGVVSVQTGNAEVFVPMVHVESFTKRETGVPDGVAPSGVVREVAARPVDVGARAYRNPPGRRRKVLLDDDSTVAEPDGE